MLRAVYRTRLSAALGVAVIAASGSQALSQQVVRAQAAHVEHTRVVHFVDGYVQPVLPTPYPFDGKLAGDGILGTGIMDTNVLRAFGVVAK